MTSFPVLSLDCAFELATSRIILELADHVVEVNEEVIDGNNTHFARVKSCRGDYGPNMATSTHSDLHPGDSGLWLVLRRKRLLSVQEEKQRASGSYLNLVF